MKTRHTVVLTIIGACAVFGVIAFTQPELLGRFGPKIASGYSYTCELCGSTREVDYKYFLGYIPRQTAVRDKYKSPGYASCPHRWEPGVSLSPPDPVADGTVVLVRENGVYGAFILRNQTCHPDYAEYDWWYQSDGTGNLNASSPNVTTGRGSTPKIRFGSFDLSWFAHANGSGWLFYKHSAGDAVTSNDLHLCVTHLTSVVGVDAADEQWKYKATPVD